MTQDSIADTRIAHDIDLFEVVFMHGLLHSRNEIHFTDADEMMMMMMLVMMMLVMMMLVMMMMVMMMRGRRILDVI